MNAKHKTPNHEPIPTTEEMKQFNDFIDHEILNRTNRRFRERAEALAAHLATIEITESDLPLNDLT